MRADDGYTLAEALVAIVMLGLAIGGLWQAMHVINRLQARSVASALEQSRGRALQQGLERHLQASGPVFSNEGRLHASASSAVLPCGRDVTCGLDIERSPEGERLVLSDARGRRRAFDLGPTRGALLTYIDDSGAHAAWPPADGEPRALRAVAVVDNGRPLATGRIWAAQPRDCVFDSIAGACRAH